MLDSELQRHKNTVTRRIAAGFILQNDYYYYTRRSDETRSYLDHHAV